MWDLKGESFGGEFEGANYGLKVERCFTHLLAYLFQI